MTETAISPKEIMDIIRRRKWGLILPSLFIATISMVVALAMPSYYKSTSTILIEEQEIPADFVMATVTSYVEQRLQSINQRIMSSSRLLDIINRFDLYSDIKGKWASEEIVKKMKDDIMMETISTDVIDKRTGRPTAATIAFTLSYEGKNPAKVQQVVNELTSFFLDENLKFRARQTKETSAFLEEEMNKVKAYLDELEKKISTFKEMHINELPEMLQVNIQSVNNIEQHIDRLIQDLRALREREGYLQTQLSAMAPIENIGDEKRLDELNLQMLALKSRFSEEHPDIVKLNTEINELKKQIETKKATNAHNNFGIDNAENPAYVNLSAQLASTRVEIESIKRQIEDAKGKRVIYQGRIDNAPKIEPEYNTLVSEKQNANRKYNDLMQKTMEARVSQGLEKEQKGERFTLIDPARLPEKPFKPNRPAIILLGVILGIGLSIGFVALIEFADDRIRNTVVLSQATSFPILAGIPMIETKRDMIRRKVKRITIMAGVSGAIFFSIVAFHFFVMDLDLLWIKIMRRMAF